MIVDYENPLKKNGINSFLIKKKKTTLISIYREDSFPRLGSMIVDYENPLKKVAEQFVPHQQVKISV